MHMRVGVAWAATVVVLLAASASAYAASPAFSPLTTNVPSLGWRGEELRLVKCVTPATDGETVTAAVRDHSALGELRFDWLVEDWSGDPFQRPQLEASTARVFIGNNEYDGAPCVKANFVSLKAGLAQIKLVVSDRHGTPLLKHQFLAAWLGLAPPAIRELGQSSTPGGGGVLGDPAGDGVLVAGGAPGRVQVQVRGVLPLGNNFTELGLPAQITLPDEGDGATSFWDELARSLATTSDPRPFYRDAPWRMWDIHDDRLGSEGHVNPGLCGLALAPIEAVDACLSAQVFSGRGAYARVFGDLSRVPTVGPFDPLRPDETLLSDGKLDSGDVPMPSALVEVGIAPNSGAATDVGGVGSLAIAVAGQPTGVYKCIPYTRDTRCTSATGPHPPSTPNVAPPPFGPAPHNHYAPYYSRWQPATSATVGSSPGAPLAREASGNDGPPTGNNFPGYRGAGLYDYWQFADVLASAEPRPTRCLERGGRFRQTPSGPQRVLVYSDEHGEAQVYFNPGRGFFFDRLGVGPNLNGGCELRDVTDLGHADITAIARYPYQKVTDADKPSNTLHKVVRHRFSKTLVCVPKGPVPPIENGFAFICTADRDRHRRQPNRRRAGLLPGRWAGHRGAGRVPDRHARDARGALPLHRHQRTGAGVGRGLREVRDGQRDRVLPRGGAHPGNAVRVHLYPDDHDHDPHHHHRHRPVHDDHDPGHDNRARDDDRAHDDDPGDDPWDDHPRLDHADDDHDGAGDDGRDHDPAHDDDTPHHDGTADHDHAAAARHEGRLPEHPRQAGEDAARQGQDPRQVRDQASRPGDQRQEAGKQEAHGLRHQRAPRFPVRPRQGLAQPPAMAGREPRVEVRWPHSRPPPRSFSAIG